MPGFLENLQVSFKSIWLRFAIVCSHITVLNLMVLYTIVFTLFITHTILILNLKNLKNDLFVNFIAIWKSLETYDSFDNFWMLSTISSFWGIFISFCTENQFSLGWFSVGYICWPFCYVYIFIMVYVIQQYLFFLIQKSELVKRGLKTCFF